MSPAHTFFYDSLLYRSASGSFTKMQKLKMARRYAIVLTGVSRGKSIREIAKRHKFNQRTIEADVMRMCEIICAKSITHLVAIAIRTKLIK